MSDDRDDEVEEEAEEAVVDDFEAEPDDGEEAVELDDADDEIELDPAIDDFVEVADGEEVEADEDEDEEESQPRARKVAEDEDEDEDEDPDDVEADLEAILRDRMAAADEDEEDEAEDGAEAPKGDGPASARNDEFVCESCFLLVNRSQFGSAKDPRCPMGDTECPSIVKIFG